MSRLVDKVLLVVWDAAEWRMIQPLLDAGLMPSLESLIDTGCMGHLASLQPSSDPLLWTSMVTGKRAVQHGIFTHVEPACDTAGIRVVVGTARRSCALWEILNRRGLRSNIVGWPLHPAEPVDGAFVTQLFARQAGALDAAPAATIGTVFPTALIPVLADFRVDAKEITNADLTPLVPLIEELSAAHAPDLELLKGMLADTATIHAAAVWLMEHAAEDFTMICYDVLDRAGHRFMPFHPPRRHHVSEDSYAVWHRVMAGLYQFCDRMLGRLLELAGPETAVMLVSPHGFHCGTQRPSQCTGSRNDVDWHREFGVFVLRAPGALCGERMWGGRILDVVPTILALFGLPVGEDMDGRVLRQAFAAPPEIHFVPTWETSDVHTTPELDEESSRAVQRSLISEGYLTEDDIFGPESRARAEAGIQYVSAVDHLESGRFAEAALLLQSLHVRFPEQPRYALHLARCWQDLGELTECRLLVEDVIRRGISPLNAAVLLSTLSCREGNDREALRILFDAEQAAPESPGIHCQIGEIYLRQERWDEAVRAFRKALRLDGDSTRAYHGLSIACLATQKFEEAAEYALTAIGLSYYLPMGHYHLGAALARLGDVSRAIRAFEVCLDQRPETKEAHTWLASLYACDNRDLQKAAYHRQFADRSSGLLKVQPAAEPSAKPDCGNA